MTSYTDRIRANADIARSRVRRLPLTVQCLGPAPPSQYLDVRVRDATAGGVPVADTLITITDQAGVQPAINVQTDRYGDVIVPIPVAGSTWIVQGVKDWFLPEPAVAAATLVAAHGFPVINLVLEELRYHLRVDADRDGHVDGQHEGLDVITPWGWGAAARGAIILCNNDNDDGPAVPGLDHEDGVVNGGNDTHELAPVEVHRTGPNTAPPANWQARLRILGGNEDKVRIFAGMAAGSVQLLGASAPAPAAGGAATPERRVHTFNLQAVAPAAMPTTTLGMEATTYPREGFEGLVRVQLTLTKPTVLPGGGNVQYSTAAEFRVAPWMMPNHNDNASRVYVVDCGPDVFNAAGVLTSGNTAFRAALVAALGPAGIAGANVVQHLPAGLAPGDRDRWMQDCMEIGYSVLPRSTPGGNSRHRIDAVIQPHRGRELEEYPRGLLAPDFGFHSPAETAAVAALDDALTPGLGRNSAALAVAKEEAVWSLIEYARHGTAAAPNPLWVDLTRVDANQLWANRPVHPAASVATGAAIPSHQIYDAAAVAAEGIDAVLRGFITAGQAAKNAMIARVVADLTALGAPYNTPAIARQVAEDATEAALAVSQKNSNTFNSGGNLECTPPCRSAAAAAGGARDYPWGRIYYGRGLVAQGQPFDQDTRAFLEAQHVQRPIGLDSDWLEVGHVDEMMSFVPVPGPQFRNWRLLLASPRRAFEIMDGLPAATPMLQNRRLRLDLPVPPPPAPPPPEWVPVANTVGVYRSGAVATPIPVPGGGVGAFMTGDELREFNLDFVQERIDDVARQLERDVGVVLDEIIHVPVVFIPGHTMNVAGALTADMVNMLVVNDHCIIPQPFGPVTAAGDEFQLALDADLNAANPALTRTFVDDWYEYHAQLGEIHCGTNTLRSPANLNAWLNTADAEWWRFDG